MATHFGNCDTELGLTPGGGGRSTAGPIAEPQQQHHQKIAVLFGNRFCVCDVTEIQARSILCMARREMEEMRRSSGRATYLSSSWPEAAALSQLLNPGVSMKKSLQRFLQKRKARVCGRDPYHQQKQHSLQPSDSSSSS